MSKEEREEFVIEVQRVYDEYLMKSEGRGMSWGECAYIENLNEEELKALYEEAEKELKKYENS